jgi:hypothetical protein
MASMVREPTREVAAGQESVDKPVGQESVDE